MLRGMAECVEEDLNLFDWTSGADEHLDCLDEQSLEGERLAVAIE